MVQDGAILADYEAMWMVTGQMLEAATTSNWDRLITLQEQREALIARIQGAGEEGVRDPVTKGRVVQLIRQILEADEKIRSLTEAWMAELKEILSSVSTEQKLQHTYQTE